MDPMTAMNLYTRQMLPFFDQTKMGPAPTAWQCFYGRTQNGSQTIYSPDSDELDMEIRKGTKRTAKLIRRSGQVDRLLGANQVNVEHGNRTAVQRVYPLSVEESDINAARKNKRLPGEPPVNSGVTAQMRMRYWAAESHYDLYMRQVRLMERLAGQSILEGVQDAILGTSDVNLQYDMYRNDDHSITLITQWTDSVNATPIQDIDNALDKASRNGDRVPKFALMGSAAIAAFTNCNEIRETADNRRYELVRCGQNVSPPAEYSFMMENGWTPWGWLRTYKGRTLWIFTQDYTWQDDENADQHVEYMPVGKVVFGSTESRNDRAFGPSETLGDTEDQMRFYREFFGFDINSIPTVGEISMNRVITPQMFMLDAYKNTSNTKVTVRCQTAPIFMTTETDTWVVIENAA